MDVDSKKMTLRMIPGVKADSLAHKFILESGAFALNILGKDQGSLAYTFFKPHERDGQTIGGENSTLE